MINLKEKYAKINVLIAKSSCTLILLQTMFQNCVTTIRYANSKRSMRKETISISML